MMKFEAFGDRLNYLSLKETDYAVPINDPFYKSPAWIQFRKQMLARDNWYDLGVPGMNVEGRLLLHHINPLTQEDFDNYSDNLLDPENVITVSYDTHNKIHYSKKEQFVPAERFPGDTKLW